MALKAARERHSERKSLTNTAHAPRHQTGEDLGETLGEIEVTAKV